MSIPKFSGKSITFRDKNFSLLQTRPFTSLSLDTIDIINMLTLDPKFPPNIVGSFKYIVHEYPADIDLFESYQDCCNLEEITNKLANKFSDIAIKLKEKKHMYLGDFKAGYDNNYKIDIGYIRGGRLARYNPLLVRSAIIKLYENNLLPLNDMNEWLSKVVENPNIEEYNDLENIIKKKYVIRWNIDELIKKSKILSNNKKISLKEALTHKSIIKIDVWVYLNMRYIEVTNFYMLTYKDSKGKINNLSVKPEKYETSLIKDLYHYNDPAVNKYMKLAKRLWLYAVLKKDKELMISLYPLFSSGASKMYQIIGEIETIQRILENIKYPYLESIIANIENWKTRLGTVMSDILPNQISHYIYIKINEIIKYKNSTDFILLSLDDINDKLTRYINIYVKLYFKLNNIDLKKYII